LQVFSSRACYFAPAFRALLQRGTEWAATGKVTILSAKDVPASKEDAERMTH